MTWYGTTSIPKSDANTHTHTYIAINSGTSNRNFNVSPQINKYSHSHTHTIENTPKVVLVLRFPGQNFQLISIELL